MSRYFDAHGFLGHGIIRRFFYWLKNAFDIYPVDPGQVVGHFRHGQAGVHGCQIGIHGFVGLSLALMEFAQNDQCFLPFPACGPVDRAMDHSGCQGIVVFSVKQKIA